MPTRTSRNVTLSQPRQLSKPRTDSVTWSCSPRTSSPGTNKNHGPSANMAYQITDLTHCHVPEGSSIVTATMRCSESNLSLNPIALYHKLLGGEGKVIRMTQLSSDSWMLLGYRYDDGTLGVYTRESPTLLNADWTSSPLGDTASDDTDHADEDEDECEYGEEHMSKCKPQAIHRNQRFSRDDMCPRQ
ncbi:hypothetical protein K469DRAFT_41848 [Zopfia rhizophila CBS 207.26]|uniref:Uncharacterized protein n=1 Tax=Zopfia rhizophila CBS 207.26 TaxID=1314779 RepID=A0A6A6EE50_9PEZI|nr:hypothetical protein K469DRAFT_41848 [Zopfia rhizophila CBS 207.26]